MSSGNASSPSTPGAGPSKPARSRSRNGCLVCRARRIKCDLDKPECARCVKYGAECVYPQKKPFDADAVRTALDKRHGQSRRSSQPSESEHINNISQSPKEEPRPTSRFGRQSQSRLETLEKTSMDIFAAVFRQTKMGSYFSSPVDPPEFLRVAFPDDDDLRCFHHCLTYSLSIIVVREDFNPWIQYVAPMFLFPTGGAPLSTEALRNSMLAIGATHLSYLHSRKPAPADEQLARTLSRRYRQKCVELLRQARQMPDELSSDSFLAATLMLNTNDASLPGLLVFAAGVEWREVWRYALGSIRSRGGCEKILLGTPQEFSAMPEPTFAPSPLHRCLIEHATLVDLIASLSTGEPPRLLTGGSTWLERLGETATSGQEWESIEASYGLQRRIIRLALTAANLVAECRTLRKYNIDFVHKVSYRQADILTRLSGVMDVSGTFAHAELEDSVSRLQQDLEEWYTQSPGMAMDPRTHMGSLAMWHACKILLRRDLQNQPRADSDIQASVRATLELCLEAGDKIEYMNWPLLIAACNATSAEDREKSRTVLRTFSYQCCYEIEVVQLVVEEMWRRIDEGRDDESCGWVEIMMELGCPVLIG
ncbi:hypothetical protein JCM24511_00043 [Saitozyma sp. JCM 24511]|nr:hypothetical protein JCM24511_00043 [Saitozyma sp. JCM 24511]